MENTHKILDIYPGLTIHERRRLGKVLITQDQRIAVLETALRTIKVKAAPAIWEIAQKALDESARLGR